MAGRKEVGRRKVEINFERVLATWNLIASGRGLASLKIVFSTFPRADPAEFPHLSSASKILWLTTLHYLTLSASGTWQYVSSKNPNTTWNNVISQS